MKLPGGRARNTSVSGRPAIADARSGRRASAPSRFVGDDWILRFSVHGDEAWLTAEKDDGSQHVEAQTADLLREAVELLEEGGGRSG